ncbi:hypothetical protein ACE1TF_13270 [Geomicrobium sp. JSM 1781026]|uniref:hypothetical protein n=1 Tax=Geomicrobium sp. JSM 1781026 TaxID=3344580 RepID=UPI0035BF34B8
MLLRLIFSALGGVILILVVYTFLDLLSLNFETAQTILLGFIVGWLLLIYVELHKISTSMNKQ